MLGVAMPGIAPVQAAAPAGPAANAPIAKGTMLGVAMPGIAPVRASDPSAAAAPPPQAAAPMPQFSQAPVPSLAGQARRAAPLGGTVALVAAPAPLEDVAAPSAPKIVQQKGVSLVMVASILGGVLLAAGVAVALLYHGAPPISAAARAAPDGKDVLHLTCDQKSCQDGTTATLGAAKTTFASGEADLTLAEPLKIGDNELVLQIVRAGIGRNETLKLVVPVLFRVHADVSTMSAVHPSITIRAEATPGSDVKIDGKPVTLDANGVGSYAVDETAATEGAADESRAISADVPYVVTPKGGAAQTGKVSARLSVAPLRVDAPGARGVFVEDQVLVAGRAAKGASVTVDGAPAAVGADGAFERMVPVADYGDKTIDVRAGTASLTQRTVHVALSRVHSLADEAKAFEAKKPIGYDMAMGNLTGSAGQPIVVEGEVFGAQGSGHRTLVLVDDRRGCAKGPCVARVVIGSDVKLARGDIIRAYGYITGGVSQGNGQTVPDVEADFFLRGKK
jgi:hypothetical protein